MRVDLFHYSLPDDLIALNPAQKRDQSRLMIIDRQAGHIQHRVFSDLAEFLKPGDVLVLNDSKVLPARLRGQKPESAGRIEMLLLEETGLNEWWTMLKPGKRVREGTTIRIHDREGNTSAIRARVLEKNEEGHCRLAFEGCPNILEELVRIGEIPLPPYIARPARPEFDGERYQTVYARKRGSVAAPTAGLHFTEELLGRLEKQEVQICKVTLHVGYGTFAPVKSANVEGHRMHSEFYEIGDSAAAMINRAKQEGRRVIAVGTTSVRVLESVPEKDSGWITAGKNRTSIFIYPPYRFKRVDALLTNFHLPKSTLLMLACAFAAPGNSRGIQLMLHAYREAIQQRYRFFSYGDAMFLF